MSALFLPLVLVLLLVLPTPQAEAQVSFGGYPPSLLGAAEGDSKRAGFIDIPAPDISRHAEEDERNDRLGLPFRFAELVPVSIDVLEQGEWARLPDGTEVCRLVIRMEGALGLQLYFDRFWIPEGGQLFIYSQAHDFILGAFTERSNNDLGLFTTQVVPGHELTIEYVPPKGAHAQPALLRLGTVAYAYRGVDRLYDGAQAKSSGPCNVNVNCSPEGDAWRDMSRAVALITLGPYQCTGTLLNNTVQDLRNFIATAAHCVEGNTVPSTQWVFYFNQERLDCSNTSRTRSLTHTITGADIRAVIPIDGGADGALLEIRGTIPAEYNVFYAGWDRGLQPETGGVSIHHPSGDRKKISTVGTAWRSATWQGEENVGHPNAHWLVQFAATPNGHGTTEGGSSGAGLFSSSGLFRGVLTGGSGSCQNPYGSNFFGKLSYLWDQHGASTSQRFNAWLDPLATGLTRLRGRDSQADHGVFWTLSSGRVAVGDTVRFADASNGSPTSWEWAFPGGHPASSTDPNPVVIYSQAGRFDVSLTITGPQGTFTHTRPNVVTVVPQPAWIEQNTGFASEARGISGITIVNDSVVWAWAYDGVNPESQVLDFTRTTNGGRTWEANTIMFSNSQGYGIGNIHAISADTAWAAVFAPGGGGRILMTTNGGASWTHQTTATFAAPDGFPNFVYFWDSQHGFSQGDPNGGYFEIYTTTNGGGQWHRVPRDNIPRSGSREFGTVNMFYVVGDTIWFGTNRGRVFRSVDRGHRWTVSSTGLTDQTNVRFRNATHGIAYTTQPLAVRRTADGGLTWTDQWISSRLRDGRITHIPGSPGVWVSVGADTLLGSSISLDDWQSFNLIDQGVQYTAVAFLNSQVGWAGGFNLDSVTGGIYRWNPLFEVVVVPETSAQRHERDSVVTGSLEVFPNPATETITIRSAHCCPGPVTVTLHDAQGRVVRRERIAGSAHGLHHTMAVGGLSRGFYILRVSSSRTLGVARVVLL